MLVQHNSLQSLVPRTYVLVGHIKNVDQRGKWSVANNNNNNNNRNARSHKLTGKSTNLRGEHVTWVQGRFSGFLVT